MKVVQINTNDIQGGAARAAYRLHKGLKQIGTDCRMIVRYKVSTDDTVLSINLKKLDEDFNEIYFLNKVIQGQYINAHRTDISNTIFSLPYPGYDLSRLSVVQDANIINLHWIAYYQSPLTLQKLFTLGKPVVWTLHDQWAFTGGCHYSAGCQKYRQDCSSCPQLAEDIFDLPAVILKDKLELFKGAKLTIVSPSRWLADCARQSMLFKDIRVEVIPNPLETDIFSPMPKSEAKKSMGISEEMLTLLFGAETNNEKRKGFQQLVAAIKYCLTSSDFRNLVKNGKINIFCFGHPNSELASIDIPVSSLGYLNSDEQLRKAYTAADILILPSLEDNLPNTMTESLSCGTPVIAFDVGGIPDVVVHGITGYLAPVGDIQQMGEAILSLIFNHEQRALMGKKGRQLIVKKCSLNTQAGQYQSLFSELHADELSLIASKDSTTLINKDVNQSIPADAPVYPESDIGPHFKRVYDKILLKALKEFVILIQRQLQEWEADIAQKDTKILKLEKELEKMRGRPSNRLITLFKRFYDRMISNPQK